MTVDAAPLRIPAFRRLFLGYGLSFVGFQLTAVAVPVQLFAITGSSVYVGLLGLVQIGPLVGFGLWGGAIADAADRRVVALVASGVAWATTVGLLIQAVLAVASVGLIMVLMAVQAAAFAIIQPTRGAIIPRLVPTSLVPAANTLTFTMGNVATVAGPLLAGVLLGRSSGYVWAYALDATLFAVSMYATVRLPKLPPQGPVARPGPRSVVVGLRFIAGRPVLLLSFVVDIIAMVLAAPRALFPEVAARRFGGAEAAGALYAAVAVGAVLGGVSSGWIGRVHRQGLALIGAVFGWGLAVAAAGLTHARWQALLLLALAGGFDLVSAVFRQTIMQVYAPDELRGRLQGVFIVVVTGGPRLGDLRAGLVAGTTGATVSWVSGGLACAVAVLALGVAFPALRRYDGRTTTPTRPADDRAA
ncbi:MAG: MFS transporter [Actinobacteria bacterium]|nr:MFS transporter [Actinomycetota bacterium]MBI3688467.1 MFS transporter [Actinomycetota bacterium]